MTEKIIIRCKGSDVLSIDKILEFQGKLKKLTKENENKLRNAMLEKGFIAPFFVWDDSGNRRLLDGHQRLKTLLNMQKDGFDIPELPVVYVDAENEKDAKEKLLLITSQYGEFELENLQQWLDDVENEVKENFRLTNEEIIDLNYDNDIEILEADDRKMGNNYYDNVSKTTALIGIGVVVSPVDYNLLKSLEEKLSKINDKEQLRSTIETLIVYGIESL